MRPNKKNTQCELVPKPLLAPVRTGKHHHNNESKPGQLLFVWFISVPGTWSLHKQLIKHRKLSVYWCESVPTGTCAASLPPHNHSRQALTVPEEMGLIIAELHTSSNFTLRQETVYNSLRQSVLFYLPRHQLCSLALTARGRGVWCICSPLSWAVAGANCIIYVFESRVGYQSQRHIDRRIKACNHAAASSCWKTICGIHWTPAALWKVLKKKTKLPESIQKVFLISPVTQWYWWLDINTICLQCIWLICSRKGPILVHDPMVGNRQQ